MVLLNGIEKIPNDQRGITITVARMAKLARGVFDHPAERARLRSLFGNLGGLRGVIAYFSRLKYRRNPAGTDWTVRPSVVVSRGFGDCNELNFAAGAILAAGGFEVFHVTADRRGDGDRVDEHYWIAVRSPQGRIRHFDVTLPSLLGKPAESVDRGMWRTVHFWHFFTGKPIMRIDQPKRVSGLGIASYGDAALAVFNMAGNYFTQKEAAKAAAARAKAEQAIAAAHRQRAIAEAQEAAARAQAQREESKERTKRIMIYGGVAAAGITVLALGFAAARRK